MPTENRSSNTEQMVSVPRDDGLLIDFIYGEDGSPLRMGDKLYLHPPAFGGFSAEQMAIQGADGYRNGIKAATELVTDYPGLAQAIRALPLPQ